MFVVLDTDRHKVRKSWVAWQEDGRLPDVVIELLSPTTEHVDRGEKKRVYERVWRMGHYVLFDPDTLALEGFELVRGRYVPLVPDARGHLSIASTGLTLGLGPASYVGETGTWLRWFDAEGRMLPTEGEAERARADEVQARADEVQARADEVQARADEVQARADEVQARADEVQARLDAAEARVRELEEALKRPR